MKIWRITFTGADDNTNLEDMQRISREFQSVEWGILFSQSRSGVARYPSHDVIEEMCKLEIHRAAHLCGAWVSDLVEDHVFTFAKTFFAPHFERVQLNCFKDRLKKALKNTDWINQIQSQQVIMGGDFSKVKMDFSANPELKKLSILFDASGGRGKEPTEWPKPINGVSCGYAGGLRPENLQKHLEMLEDVIGNRHIWIDMESGVRTNDVFDLEKVQQCLEIAKPWL